MAERIRTTCFDCHSKCGVMLTVEDSEIIKVEGDPQRANPQVEHAKRQGALQRSHEQPPTQQHKRAQQS